jgi:hypothetical protein
MRKFSKTVIVLVLLAGFSLSMLRPDTMGHSPHLFRNADYTALFRNAISWAAQP